MDAQAIYMYQNNQNDPPSRGSQRPGNGSNNGNNSGGPKDSGSSLLIRSIIIIVVLLVGWYLFEVFTSSSSSSTANTIEIPYSTFYRQVEDNNVDTLVFQGQDATGTLKSDITIRDVNGNTKTGDQFHFTQLPNGDPQLTALLIAKQVNFSAKPAPNNNLLNIVINVLPWILIVGIIILVFRNASRSQQNIFSFGKSRAKVVLEDRPSTTFADVAGVDEAKNDLVEVVEFPENATEVSAPGR